MFEALRKCPDAIVIKPNMAKYVAAGRAVRQAMFNLTPLVEPLSIDEAFLDLTGTERLHGMNAAKVLARFARQVERDIGITVSIGLSANKFLAKIASDMDKPRGFAVLGQDEAAGFLAPKPVGFIYGVGAVSAAKLSGDGYRLISDLQRADKMELAQRYGEEGTRLWHLARGLDHRAISADRETKSVSAETTFNEDISEFRPLEQYLWALTDRVSTRLKANALAGSTVTLKLKTTDFKNRTRARSLGHPTQLASRIFSAGRDLLKNEIGQTRYRLIGIGVSHLEDAAGQDLSDLIDRRAAGAELAVDRLREKFGKDVVVKGLALDDE
jgi:DNA polymerase IV